MASESNVPAVSVVMPVHNAARFLDEAVNSVLAQEPRDLELILIDDGSTDDSLERIRAIPDTRIVLITNASAGGPARARNQGIAAAKAPYIAFLDADDVMKPGALADALRALEAAPTASIAFTDFERIDLQGQVTVTSVLAEYNVLRATAKQVVRPGWSLITSATFNETLLYEQPIGMGSVVLRRNILLQTGLFDETLVVSEDRDLWFRIARSGDALFGSGVSFSYRINTQSVSHGPTERNSRNRITVLRRERKHWAHHPARAQIDSLIAENLAAIGYTLRGQGRRLASLKMFAAAWRADPAWHRLKTLLGGVTGTMRRTNGRSGATPGP